ncbi:WSC domain-containing protein [Podospora didyma]|uniref:WSC domain-containing protein n=1 Tax=Podospora didyma TaxID=330526 RepID=A0AAE0N926_9PEZI|nr:WSC domain-containing protein [Podospora didyma]
MHSSAILLLSVLASSASALVSTAYGCYKDSAERTGTKSLTSARLDDFTPVTGMTLQECEDFCLVNATGAPYLYWGVEYGGECYCGNSLSTGTFKTFDTDCKVICKGSMTEVCGDGNRLSLYGTPTTAPADVPIPISPAVSAYLPVGTSGCWAETSPRALSGSAYASTAMTNAACGNVCKNDGFVYFGTEYGSECYCGNSFTSVETPGDCTMDCAGDNTQDCGNGNRLSVNLWS